MTEFRDQGRSARAAKIEAPGRAAAMATRRSQGRDAPSLLGHSPGHLVAAGRGRWPLDNLGVVILIIAQPIAATRPQHPARSEPQLHSRTFVAF